MSRRCSGCSGRWPASGPWPGKITTFRATPPEKIPYAVDRYVKETNRLYGVLKGRLADREYVAGEYSIADMAAYPWIVPHEAQSQNLADFPHLRRWFEAIGNRPATIRAYALAAQFPTNPSITDEQRKVLFGQTAESLGKR